MLVDWCHLEDALIPPFLSPRSMEDLLLNAVSADGDPSRLGGLRTGTSDVVRGSLAWHTACIFTSVLLPWRRDGSSSRSLRRSYPVSKFAGYQSFSEACKSESEDGKFQQKKFKCFFLVG